MQLAHRPITGYHAKNKRLWRAHLLVGHLFSFLSLRLGDHCRRWCRKTVIQSCWISTEKQDRSEIPVLLCAHEQIGLRLCADQARQKSRREQRRFVKLFPRVTEKLVTTEGFRVMIENQISSRLGPQREPTFY